MKNSTLLSALILLLLFAFTSCQNEQVLPDEVKSESSEKISQVGDEIGFEEITSYDQLPAEYKNAEIVTTEFDGIEDISTLPEMQQNARSSCTRQYRGFAGLWGAWNGGTYPGIYPTESRCSKIAGFGVYRNNQNNICGVLVHYRNEITGNLYTPGIIGTRGNRLNYGRFYSNEVIEEASLYGVVGTGVFGLVLETNRRTRRYGSTHGSVNTARAPRNTQILGFVVNLLNGSFNSMGFYFIDK